jgi:hypothetical protein
MKKATSKKSVWTYRDTLQKLLVLTRWTGTGSWQQVLDILTASSAKSGSNQPETPHLLASLEVTRRTQIVREFLMAIPRRQLPGGAEGKAVIPMKSILRRS